jgi:hypothetical protein
MCVGDLSVCYMMLNVCVMCDCESVGVCEMCQCDVCECVCVCECM